MRISNHTFCEETLSIYSDVYSNALFEIFYFELNDNNDLNNNRLTVKRSNKNNLSQTEKIIMILNLYLHWNESKLSENYWSKKLRFFYEKI